MTATMDVRRVSHMMDVVAMRSVGMYGMFHRQADGFDDGWRRGCSRFWWSIVRGYQLSGRNAVRPVRFIHRDVKACLFELFLNIQLSIGLELT
jgi:hypothetical protein